MKLAGVYEALGDQRTALELVTQGKIQLSNSLSSALCIFSQADLHYKTPVMDIRQVINERPGYTDGVTSQQLDDPDDAFFVAARPNRSREIQRARMNKQQTEEAIIRRVKNGFDRLAELDEGVDQNDAEAIADWLDVAGGLVEGFRQTRALFPADRVRRTRYRDS